MTAFKLCLGTLVFLLQPSLLKGAIAPVAIPADVLKPEAVKWVSFGKGEGRQSLLVVNVISYNQQPAWFLTTGEGGGVSKISTPPFPLHQINDLAVSPDEKLIAIASAGEGHPQIAVASLAGVLSGKAKKEMALIDPYPGYVKLDGWRGQKVLVTTDVPLDKKEKDKPYPDPTAEAKFQFLYDPRTNTYVKP